MADEFLKNYKGSQVSFGMQIPRYWTYLINTLSKNSCTFILKIDLCGMLQIIELQQFELYFLNSCMGKAP